MKKMIAAICMSAVLALCGTAMAGCKKKEKEPEKQEADIIIYCRELPDVEYRLTREQPIVEATFVKPDWAGSYYFFATAEMKTSGRRKDFSDSDDSRNWLGITVNYMDAEPGEPGIGNAVDKLGRYEITILVDQRHQYINPFQGCVRLNVILKTED